MPIDLNRASGLVVLIPALIFGTLGCTGADDDGFGGDDDFSAGDDDDTTASDDDDDDTTASDDDDDDTTASDDDDDDTTASDDDDDDTTASDDDDDDTTVVDDDDDATPADDDDSAGDDDDSAGDDDDSAGDDDDSEPLTVALVDTGSSGVAPIENILLGEGHTVDRMDYATVESSLDASYDVLVYPGSGGGVWAVINNPGLGPAIRDFVGAGGGYIGVCGGSIAGASVLVYNGVTLPGLMVGLLDVEATYHDDWSAYVGNMTELQIEVAAQHEVLPGLSVGDTRAADYAGGPTFESFTVDIPLLFAEDLDPGLAGYQITGSGALAVGEYGAGRVVLSATHPEYNHPDRLLQHVAWVRP